MNNNIIIVQFCCFTPTYSPYIIIGRYKELRTRFKIIYQLAVPIQYYYKNVKYLIFKQLLPMITLSYF